MGGNRLRGFALMNDFFDHIYVLTLKRSTVRQQHVCKALDGLRWCFFYGQDKELLDGERILAERVYDDVLHRSTKRTHRSMKLGEIACALSHRAIYADILKNDYQRALVLEDDVSPVYEYLGSFKEVVRELPVNWELLMLGYYGEKPPILRYRLQREFYSICHHLHLFRWHKVSKQWILDICMSPYSDHLYRIGKVVGAHAYAVTLSAAEKFVRYQTPIILQADRVFNYYKAANGLEAFAVRNKLFSLSEWSKISYIGYE